VIANRITLSSLIRRRVKALRTQLIETLETELRPPIAETAGETSRRLPLALDCVS
jgi:hypothetical protein